MRRSVLFFPFVLVIGCGSASETTTTTADESTPLDPTLAAELRPPPPLAEDQIVRLDESTPLTRPAAEIPSDTPASSDTGSRRLRPEGWRADIDRD